MFKRIISVLAVVCMVIGCAGCSVSGGSQKNAGLSESDFLKASGKYLCKKSGEGEAVLLRGTNSGGWFVQEFWMCTTLATTYVVDQTTMIAKLKDRFGDEKTEELIKCYEDNFWTEKDFDNCKSLGINCIRVPLWYMNFTDDEGNMRENAFEKLDWFVKQASDRGIYVIIDMHGAYGSQNGSDHSGKDGGSYKQMESKFFFGKTAKDNQELFYKLWEKIAEHYKGNPAVAGYDLLNEPYCTYRYNTIFPDETLHAVLWDIYDKAYQRIRAIDPDHVIIMEATWDPVDLPDPSQYGWTNVMYEYHNYLYDDYDNKGGGQISNMKKKIDAIKAANYDVPSYMGEFCYMNNPDAWKEGLALLTGNEINWTTWTYKVVESYGNWGLYNQKDLRTDIENDSFETIKEKWSKAGESFENKLLLDAIRDCFTSEVKLNKQ
ncbi:MAG: cellulase family glycosylhydrolase [Lachnospiraceae bacterium]|nr:cellulase family glycosylhydrolase [Lachnospiraceae bacterium]